MFRRTINTLLAGLLCTGLLLAQKPEEPKKSADPREEVKGRIKKIDPVKGIVTSGADVMLPLLIPLPADYFMLGRQARWRLFFDYGTSVNPQNNYRDAGVGFLIPFGGDLVGKESITMLTFSTLAVLYREFNGEASTRPGLIFDFDFIGKI